MNIRLIGFSLAAFVCGIPGSTLAQIFVTNPQAGTIGEYTTSGVPVNPALITGLSHPWGSRCQEEICLSRIWTATGLVNTRLLGRLLTLL